MSSWIERIRSALIRAGQGIRALARSLAGEDAYERFLAHHLAAHPDVPPPDRRRFYLDRENQKWRGINRCC